MYHSKELEALTDALAILKIARQGSSNITFAWERLQNASQYLQKQISAHFAETL